jgi:DnaJ-class molecular chaperone
MRVKCQFCNGTGIIGNHEKCPECNGTGLIVIFSVTN